MRSVKQDNESIPRFSDFADERGALEGDKAKIHELLNTEIIVVDYVIRDSKYSKNKSGKYLTIQFKRQQADDPRIFFTGSDVLIDQIQRYEDKMPFIAEIRKVNRYYTFA